MGLNLETQLVVFDLDGTLLNSMDGLADCAVSVLGRFYGLEQNTARVAYKRTSGVPFFQQLEILFPKDSRNQAAHEAFSALKRDAYLSWEFFPGAEDLLLTLNDAGFEVAISSNSEHHLVKRLLKKKNLQVGCALGWQPDLVKGPGHFSYFESHFGVNRREMLFVGDSLWDAKFAMESEVPFVAKLGTLSRRDFESHNPHLHMISEISELQDLLISWKPLSKPSSLLREAASV